MLAAGDGTPNGRDVQARGGKRDAKGVKRGLMNEGKGSLAMKRFRQPGGAGLPGHFSEPGAAAAKQRSQPPQPLREADEMRVDAAFARPIRDFRLMVRGRDQVHLKTSRRLFRPAPAQPMFARAPGVAGVGDHQHAGFHAGGRPVIFSAAVLPSSMASSMPP